MNITCYNKEDNEVKLQSSIIANFCGFSQLLCSCFPSSLHFSSIFLIRSLLPPNSTASHQWNAFVSLELTAVIVIKCALFFRNTLSKVYWNITKLINTFDVSVYLHWVNMKRLEWYVFEWKTDIMMCSIFAIIIIINGEI